MGGRELKRGDMVADRYRIDAKLGQGGMGAVYKATQTNLDRQIALKVILPEYAQLAGARARFEREARVASSLRHTGSVQIFDFGEHDDTLYLSMELLDGHSLRAIVDLDKPPLGIERSCRIAREIADVFVAAHPIPLIHRDIKPENIFLDLSDDKGERVVVLDFGLAFIADNLENVGRMTREGVVTGTPDYLSPEQARGSKVGPACDIYSLGCVLYEMLTSAVPFNGEGATLLAKHMYVPPKPLKEVVPDLQVPSILDELVIRMLAKAPEARPLARDVRDTLAGLDPNSTGRTKKEGRGSGQAAIGRAGRMISASPVNSAGDTYNSDKALLAQNDRVIIGTTEELDPQIQLGLAANGVQCGKIDDDGVVAVFAPDASLEEVQRLARAGLPVIADADKADLDRLSSLLRAGAAEVLIRPVDATELARKVARVVRKSKRGRK